MSNAKYRYDQAGKSALRAAITSHIGWPAIREIMNLNSASLSTEIMELVASKLVPAIDCSQFGKPKWNGSGWQGSSTPKPRTVEPAKVDALKNRYGAVVQHVSADDRAKFGSICQTILKQDGWATEKQFSTLESIVVWGELAARDPLPVAAEPVTSQPVTAPEPHPAPAPSSVQAALSVLAGALQQQQTPALDENRIIALIKQHSASPTVSFKVQTPAGVQVSKNVLAHHKMPLLLAAIAAGVNVMLVGGAGSGKTHACKLAAELLGLGFKFTGAIDSPYKLTGFTDAQGRTVRTPFREAVEHGGLFLQDEADACLPGALLPINAVASNGLCDFPDAIVQAHADFRLVMACNTFGKGADRQYVGRHQQDAAVLDRYAVLPWDTDPALEAAMLGLPRPAGAPAMAQVQPIEEAEQQQRSTALWLARVQTIRSRVEKHKIRHVVSPRASVMGSKLLVAGWPWDDVEEACLFKGMDSDTRAKLNA